MNFLHLMRRSMAVKHVLLLFLLIALVLGAGGYVLYRSVHTLLWHDIQNEAFLICQENVNQYDQRFSAYQNIARVIADNLAEMPSGQWESTLSSAIGKLMQIHPEIYAVGAATIPEADSTGKLLLALQKDGAVEVREGTGYAEQSWFSEIVQSKTGKWSEPFHGQVIQDFIAVYSLPIFRKMPEGGKEMVGVACLDLKIDWLNSDVNEISLDKQGFAVLFSRQGSFLASKFPENIGKKYDELSPQSKEFLPDTDTMEEILQFIKSKQQKAFVFMHPLLRKKIHLYFRQMQTTGWNFLVVFPEETILASIKFLQTSTLIQLLGLSAVLLLSAFLLLQRISIPLHNLSCFAEEIGKGNFSAPIPVVKGHDEIADMAVTIDRMRYSLIEYIRSVQKITELEEERAKNRKLLLNTLPEHVIEEFNLTGKCTPEYAESATVFFSDIVGFTTRCSELPAAVIIEELNSIFSNFDRIFLAHGVERIKTIGDAYMAIAGLHPPKDQHCDRVLDAALEARRYLQKRNAESKLQWQIRIGIHTGAVAAGIVGVERYIYDVFGDAVNTAARMEQLSEPMQINVSEAVQLVASSRRFTKRPAIEVKGKGLLQMYFLEDNAEETREI